MGRSNKGSPYEREVCRLLTDWWRGYESDTEDVLYWRTSQSGGRATTRRRKGKKANVAHCGDVSAVGAEGAELTRLITFELKRGYSSPRSYATLSDLVDRQKHVPVKGIEEWIVQAVTAAEYAKTRYWAIVHRRDARDHVMYLPTELYDDLRTEGMGFRIPTVHLTAKIRFPEQGSLTPVRTELTALPFQAFLDGVDPLWVVRLLRHYGE